MIATAATGTTTATAILLPADKPPVLPESAPDVARAAAPEVLEDLEDAVTVRVGPFADLLPDCVEVRMTVCGPALEEGPESELVMAVVTTTRGGEETLVATLDSEAEGDCVTVDGGPEEVTIAAELVDEPLSEPWEENGKLEVGIDDDGAMTSECK